MSQLDQQKQNDNRCYDYSGSPDAERKEYAKIVQWVGTGATVVDLGCGNGSLLEKLRREKSTIGAGIEIAESGVAICRSRGLDVVAGRVDQSLPYKDQSFDFAICNVTIQMVMYPEILLKEMKRIARQQIVSFPNYAFYQSRIDVMLHGRVPKPSLFGHQWYSTGHIHPLSIADFHELVHDVGGLEVMEVQLEHVENPVKDYLMQSFPNLFQLLPIFLLRSL